MGRMGGGEDLGLADTVLWAVPRKGPGLTLREPEPKGSVLGVMCF